MYWWKTEEYKQKQAEKDLLESDLYFKKTLFQCIGYQAFSEMLKLNEDQISRKGLLELIYHMNDQLQVPLWESNGYDASELGPYPFEHEPHTTEIVTMDQYEDWEIEEDKKKTFFNCNQERFYDREEITLD